MKLVVESGVKGGDPSLRARFRARALAALHAFCCWQFPPSSVAEMGFVLLMYRKIKKSLMQDSQVRFSPQLLTVVRL